MEADRPADRGGKSSRSAEIWSELSSDAELITAARGGDSAAFGTLYERHAPAARAVARQYTRSSADAEDIVSDGFIRVFAVVRAGGGPDIAFRAYLFTVVRRLAHAGAQGGRRVQPTDDMAVFESAFGAAGSPEDPALAGFERGVVAKAYASLPERWQAALWYTEIEQLSAAQIAPLLGLTANGVAALAYRAREGLRQAYLQQHLAEPQSDRCRTVNDKFGAYVRGGLAKRETAQVEAHLDTCGECRSLVLELGDVNHGLRVVIAPLILGVIGLGALASPLPVGGLVGIGAGVMAGSAASAGTAAATAGSAAAGTAAAGTAAGTAGSAAAGSAMAGAAAASTAAGTAAAGTAAAAPGGTAATAGAVAGTAATVGAAAGTAAAGAAAATAGTAAAAGTLVGSVAGSAAVAAGAMAGTAAVAVGTAGAAAATGGVAALVALIPMSVVGAVAAGLVAGSLAIAGVNGIGDPGDGGAGQVLAGPTASPSPSTTDALTDELLAVGGAEGLPESGTVPGPADLPADVVAPVDVPLDTATVTPEDSAATDTSAPEVSTGSASTGTTPASPTPTGTTPVSNPNPPVTPTPTPTPEPPPLTPADLRVVGEVAAGVLAAGSDGQVSFTIANAGQASARDLRAELALPAGITYAGASSSADDWACGSPAGSSTVVCTMSGLAGLSSGSLTFGVRVAEEFAAAEADLGLTLVGGVVNVGTIVHTSVQPAPARLALDLTSNAALEVDTAAFVTVPVRNAGGVRTGSLRVGVRMPAGIHWEGTDAGIWTCVEGADPRDLVCTTGPVAPRTAVPLPLRLRAADDALGQPSALAIVATHDESAEPVRGEVAVTVRRAPAELAVSSPGRVTAVAGTPTRVQLTVANVGRANAADVVVGVAAPPGVSVQSAGCTGGPTGLTCTLGAVPAGDSRVLAFDVLADGSAAGDLATGVTLTVTAPDTAPLVSQVPITVTAPRLAFTASSLPRVVLDADHEGGHHQGTVNFAVSNTGSADARDVAATVLLPAGLWVASDGATTCTRVAGGVVCDLGDLAPGATKPVELEVHIDGAPELAVNVSVAADRLEPIALTAG